MGKLRGLGRATKRAQNENAPGTPALAVRTPGPTTPGAGSASSTVGVAVATPATAQATAPSGTPVCLFFFPFLSLVLSVTHMR
jgi:hypothetical protein